MNSFKIRIFSFVVFAMVNMAVYADAFACTPISSVPYTISASGSYCLTDNLTFSEFNGNAITVAASDVILDFNEKSLMGSYLNSTSASGDTGVKILPNASRTTIKNGVIVGFYRGVAGGGSGYSNLLKQVKVYNMELVRIASHGIDFYDYSSEISITHNKISIDGTLYTGQNGIVARGVNTFRANAATITDNEIVVIPGPSHLMYGISVGGASEIAYIKNNLITGNIIIHSQNTQSAAISLLNLGLKVIVSDNQMVSFYRAVYALDNRPVCKNNTILYTSSYPYGACTDLGGNTYKG